MCPYNRINFQLMNESAKWKVYFNIIYVLKHEYSTTVFHEI